MSARRLPRAQVENSRPLNRASGLTFPPSSGSIGGTWERHLPAEIEALQHVADIGPSITRRRGRSEGLSVRRIVVRSWGFGIELMIDRGQRRQAEDRLDEFQNRAVLVYWCSIGWPRAPSRGRMARRQPRARDPRFSAGTRDAKAQVRAYMLLSTHRTAACSSES